MFQNEPKIRIQKIQNTLFEEKGIDIQLLRLDEVHPYVSGNKWYKLKYNLQQAKSLGFDTVLTFGGAFSNHILATAAAAHDFGFKSIGIIRGEEHLPLNSTLSKSIDFGMRLKYISRSDYREKESDELIDLLKRKFGDFYLIPEGGTNELAVKGTLEILGNVSLDFDYVCLPVGTGGTIAGVVKSIDAKVLGFATLKGDFLSDEVSKWTSKKNFKIVNDYHFGGYAKHKQELIEFINLFYEETHIPLDPIYTGKMMFGVYDMIKKGFFEKGSTLVCIHTGGLQGIEGFNQRFKNIIKT